MDIDDLRKRFRGLPDVGYGQYIKYNAVCDGCLQLAIQIDVSLPDGQEKSLAITNLEQVMLWSCIGLTRADN